MPSLKTKAWIDVNYVNIFKPPFNEGSHWGLPASPEVVQAMQNSFATSSAPQPRAGAAIRQGRRLPQYHPTQNDGGTAYKLGWSKTYRWMPSGPSFTTPKVTARRTPENAYSINNITGEEERRRVDHRSVRRQGQPGPPTTCPS